MVYNRIGFSLTSATHDTDYEILLPNTNVSTKLPFPERVVTSDGTTVLYMVGEVGATTSGPPTCNGYTLIRELVPNT